MYLLLEHKYSKITQNSGQTTYFFHVITTATERSLPAVWLLQRRNQDSNVSIYQCTSGFTSLYIWEAFSFKMLLQWSKEVEVVTCKVPPVWWMSKKVPSRMFWVELWHGLYGSEMTFSVSKSWCFLQMTSFIICCVVQ